MKRLLALIAIEDVLFFGGLGLLGYGLSHIYAGSGQALVGLLLVIYARPLTRWIR